MKLLVEVKEATCPAAGVCWPLFAKPDAITLGSSATGEKKKHEDDIVLEASSYSLKEV